MKLMITIREMLDEGNMARREDRLYIGIIINILKSLGFLLT